MTTPRWKLQISEILDTARTEAKGGAKTASAPKEEAPLIKQATDVIAALRLCAGEEKGAEAGTSPGVTSTTTSGTQAEPPRTGSAGKTTMSPGPSAARPTESATPDGKQKDMPFAQKKATLHDIVMQGRQAEAATNKEAGKGGPEEYDALQGGKATTANEGALQRFFKTNETPVDMTKRDAKAPTRARLREAFKHVDDSANEAAARAAFPAAVAKGSLKMAAAQAQKVALFGGGGEPSPEDLEFAVHTQQPQSAPGRFFHRMGLGFHTPEMQQEIMDTGEFGMPGIAAQLRRQAIGIGAGGAIGAGLGAGAGALGAVGGVGGALQGARDRVSQRHGFDVQYQDRSFPGATTLLGQKRVVTPPQKEQAPAQAPTEHTASVSPRQLAAQAQSHYLNA